MFFPSFLFYLLNVYNKTQVLTLNFNFMPNWCDTTIQVLSRKFKSAKKNAEAVKQFKDFVKKFQEANKNKKFEEKEFLEIFYPMPASLNIASGSTTENGIAVLLSQKYKDHSKIDEIMQYEWVKKDKTIKTREDLIKYLLQPTDYGDNSPVANLKEAQIAIDNIKKYGCKDWYDWRVQHWGTKWELDISDINIGKYDLTICSMTAWTPPLNGVTKISEDYPLLHFTVTYAEPGCGFQGAAEIEEGSCSNFYEDYTQDEENEEDDDM